jgi:hypothetical protein
MSAPERIYLQWIEDESVQYIHEGVTWCADKIEDDDVEYVRADLPRGTNAQILMEREITASSIQGAMAFGYQGTNPPPEADHWLAPFWEIGRKQAALEGLKAAVEAGIDGWDRTETLEEALDRIDVLGGRDERAAA